MRDGATFRNGQTKTIISSDPILDSKIKQNLQEVSDTHWLDSVGDYHGVQHEKYVYNFDGTDGILNIKNYTVTKSFTTTFIIFIENNTNNQSFLSSTTQTLGLFKRRSGLDNKISLRFGVDGEELTDYILTEGWHTIVWNYNFANKEHNIYVNETLVTWVANNVQDIDETVFSSISNATNYFYGKLSYFKIEDEDGIFVEHLCEEQLGTIAYDSSGNNNHGTLIGNVTHDTVRVAKQSNKDLITNGDFYYNDDSWIVNTAAGWSIANGKATRVNAGMNGGIEQADLVEFGKSYKLTLDIIEDDNRANLIVYIAQGGQIVSIIDSEPNVLKTFVIYFTSKIAGTQKLLFNAIGNWQGSIENIQLIETKVSLVNHANEEGYSLGTGSNENVIIPRLNTDHTKDIFNNDLQFVGQVASDTKLMQSNCIELNGIDGSGVITDSSNINFNNDFELEVSFNLTRIGEFDTIFCMHEEGNYRRVTVDQRDNGKIGFAVKDSNNNAFIQNTTKVLIDGKDHTVRYVADRTTDIMKIYVDGILDGEYSMHSINNDITNGKFYIGEFGTNSKYLKGKLWNIKIKSGVSNLQFPLAEGVGTTSYAKNDQTKQITWINGTSWSTQNSFHYNINEGFTKGSNMLSYSNNFSDNDWARTGLTLVGINRFVIDTSNGPHHTVQNELSILANINYYFRFKIKKVDWDSVKFNLYDGVINLSFYYNFSLNVFLGSHVNYSNLTAIIQENGFVLISGIVFSNNTSNNGNVAIGFGLDSNSSFLGDGTSSIIFREIQFKKADNNFNYEITTNSPTANVNLPYRNSTYNYGKNYIKYSEELQQYDWVNLNTTVTANEEGVADKLVDTDSDKSHFYQDVYGLTQNENYTLSFDVKGTSDEFPVISIYDLVNGNFIQETEEYVVTNTEYNTITYSFVTPSLCTSVKVYLNRIGEIIGEVTNCLNVEAVTTGTINVEDEPLLWLQGNNGAGYYDTYKGDTFEISGSGCVYGGSVADYELNTRINIDSRNLTTQLNEVFLSKFTELTDLAVQDNNIQIIEPRLNLKLVNLLCHTNDINNLVVYGLLNLRRLEFYDNNISVIDTVDLINLREIIGYQNNLTEVNLTNSTLLEKIILFSNEITTIDTTTNVLITELKIQSNLLTDINIANNILLKDIRLHNNRLSNIKNSDVLVTLNNFNSSLIGGYFQSSIFGGGSLTTAGAAAKAALQGKGWTIIGI
jgi:hypothetical protein